MTSADLDRAMRVIRAKCKAGVTFDEAQAAEISREIWGHRGCSQRNGRTAHGVGGSRRMIDLDEVRFLAVHRCFDILQHDADAVAAHVLAGRFDPIAVLDALERIEERRKRSAASRPRITTADIAKSMLEKPR